MAAPDQDSPSGLRKTTRLVAAVATAPITIRERLNRCLLPLALLLGALGMLALLLCVALWSLPPARWPDGVDHAHLTNGTMLSLLFASLLGWGCMQKGVGRLRKRTGYTLGRWLFVGMPLACGLMLLAVRQGLVLSEELPGGPPLLSFATWYPPALVLVSLLAYVGGSSRLDEEGRLKRGFWFTLLVSPYGLLLSYLLIGFDAPWLEDGMEETIHELGSGAIVAQVALAYFCGGGGSSS